MWQVWIIGDFALLGFCFCLFVSLFSLCVFVVFFLREEGYCDLANKGITAAASSFHRQAQVEC